MKYFCPRIFINILSKILKVIKSLLIIAITILSKSLVINLLITSLKLFIIYNYTTLY